MTQPIIKAINDDREYKTYVLNNGLRVFIIKDPKAKLSACSLNVNIGSLYDTVEGIAHFLEHMLFMGSTKYPDEDLFMRFVSMNGGVTNAFTSHDNTCYYFNIENNKLIEILDIFANVFISPLLKEDAVMREINAVHAEHQKNINSDQWREFEMTKVLCHKTHPYHRFSTGSLETLKIDGIHHKVKEFYNKYYSSDGMILTIVYNDIDPKTIEQFVNEIFGKISKKLHTISKSFGNLLEKNKIIKYVPIKDKDVVNILWELPSSSSDPKKSPLWFLSNILGHEGENSIYETLTQKGWIYSLSSGVIVAIHDRVMFNVTAKLSNDGLLNIGAVVNFIYDYITMMKNSISKLKELYEEGRTINNITFKYAEKIDSLALVLLIPERLTGFNILPHEVLALNMLSLPYEDIKNNLQSVLNLMVKENSIVMVSSRLFSNKTNLIEPYYNVDYSVINGVSFTGQCNIEPRLPPLNTYLSTNFTILKGASDLTPRPIKYVNNIRTFYQFDSDFNLPKVVVYIKVQLPNICKNVANHISFAVYMDSVMIEINRFISMANNAGYVVSISVDEDILNMCAIGFSDKINDIIEMIINAITSYNISDIAYTSTVNNLTHNLSNIAFVAPHIKADLLTKKVLMTKVFDYKSCLSILGNITKEYVINKINEIFETGSVDIYVYGNCKEDLANKITQIVNTLPIKTNYKPTMFERKDIRHITGKKTVIEEIENPSEKNSALNYVIELYRGRTGNTENWNYNYCLSSLLNCILSSSYFDQLRTKEQLGYIVTSKVLSIGDPYIKNMFMTLIVQSLKSPEYLIMRTEEFLTNFVNILNELPEDEFKNYIKGLSLECVVVLETMLDKSIYFYDQIDQGTYMYNVREILYETYQKIKKEDLIKFFNDKAKKNNILIVGIKST